MAGHGGKERQEEKVRDAQSETQGVSEGREDQEQVAEGWGSLFEEYLLGSAKTLKRSAAVARPATSKAIPGR